MPDSSGNNLSATGYPIAFKCYVRTLFRKHKGGAIIQKGGDRSVRKVTQELSLQWEEIGQSYKEGKGVFSKAECSFSQDGKKEQWLQEICEAQGSCDADRKSAGERVEVGNLSWRETI